MGLTSSSQVGATSVAEAVTCLGCGCMCDDLRVEVQNGAIAGVDPDCGLARLWFDTARPASEAEPATLDGCSVSFDEAIARAGELLTRARAPLFLGLTRSATETVREALALADHLGGRVWLDRSHADLGRVAAFAQSGRVSATLGEVKNRADVVVFLGADPVTSHPRHWERYSVDAPGRFVQQGRAGRFVIVIDGAAVGHVCARRFVHPLPGRARAGVSFGFAGSARGSPCGLCPRA